MKTWRKEILREMEKYGETWHEVEDCTMTDEQLDKNAEGEDGDLELDNPSYTWTTKRVYFVSVEECWNWITSVPRDPCDCKPECH
jgi:hypothetical protein